MFDVRRIIAVWSGRRHLHHGISLVVSSDFHFATNIMHLLIKFHLIGLKC